MLFFARKMW